MKFNTIQLFLPILFGFLVPLAAPLTGIDTLNSSLIYIHPFIILGPLEYGIGPFFSMLIIIALTLILYLSVSFFIRSAGAYFCFVMTFFIFCNYFYNGEILKIETWSGVVFAGMFYFAISGYGQICFLRQVIDRDP